MIKLLTKIKRFFFGPKTEIEFVEAALARYEWQLEEMHMRHRHSCCTACATGGESNKLADKIERVYKWLEVLKKRKEKKNK